MNAKGFIFDLDGVIVDTAKYHYMAWKKLANTLGFDITEIQNEQLKGVSRVKSLEIIMKWGNINYSEALFNRYLEQKNADYLSHIEKMTVEELLPGVNTILDYLRDKKQSIALGSASKNAKIILKKTRIYHKFNAVVDGNEVLHAKPDPEVFYTAAEKINVAPEHCMVFEDSIAGIEAANKAGMVSVGIGNNTVLGHADYVFKNVTEIHINFIDQFLKR